ncbi:MAG TPA: DUF1491 family protein [Xanthobacteraceae bacterium]|nr:DUF1491 family protein [Xanthobacteraceae bacterium]
MRLKSAIWVSAYVRRCHLEGAFAVLRRKGAEEAGAIFIKVTKLDGTAALYAPAPQTSFEGAKPADRLFISVFKQEFEPEAAAETKIAREIEFDPDIWVVEVEDRAGRHFLDLAK